MSEHEAVRDLIGAYVLGALAPTDRRRLDDHLAECRRCRDEVVELAPVPGLLGQVTVDDLVVVPPTSADAVVEGARAHLLHLRASRRRWRLAAAGGAVAAMVLLGAVLADGGGGGPGGGRDTVTLVLDAPASVSGTIAADERTWGTYLHVSLEGLPERTRYRMWVVDREAGWHEAGTWRGSSGRAVRLGGSTHLALADIAEVVVTSDERSDEILVARAR